MESKRQSTDDILCIKSADLYLIRLTIAHTLKFITVGKFSSIKLLET